MVLSACQTAITDFNHLPEKLSAYLWFLQAGVPGVMEFYGLNDLYCFVND